MQNTKILLIFCFLTIVSGLGFLYLGLNQPALKPVVESVQTEVTQSAILPNQAFVTHVIDGDTIEIENGQRVRLLGVDTPETVDLRRPVGCFGKQASNKSKELLSGKIVILEKDVSEADKYGRLLRFVYLPLLGDQTLFVNDYLIREGYGKVLTIPPDVKFAEQFLEAQRKARELKKGLWGNC